MDYDAHINHFTEINSDGWCGTDNIKLIEQLNILRKRQEALIAMNKPIIAAQISIGINQLEAQLKTARKPKGQRGNETKRNYQL